ncbi:tetratricopeptide repeat protein [Mucilaginibacter ginsenosidivorans]|uniref:Tetratricopeptide repeat protein n=1 Tax=Mucilaginibacter ginsenosidivorans TaxID=398053 RepID=A0A5B8UT55_9SPHI|nr:tetratricopeptide repeat protein [Mucilaginibacter ginsenosidivorans]QEC62169.1 tetratricopeptide repeat protein [Mucilaginibacter ginsenosidivorans]
MDSVARRFYFVFGRLSAFLFLLFFIVTATFAQQKIADSLLQQLKAHSQKDTSYVRLLNQLSMAYAPFDNKAGMAYANQALLLSKSLSSSHALATSYLTQARVYEFGSKPRNAITAAMLALNEFKRSNNDTSGLVDCYLKLSANYYNTANYITALDYVNKALLLAQQTGDKKRVAACYNTLGSCYTLLADYPKASAFYYKELKLADSLQNKSMIAKTTGNLGVVNYYLKNYSASLKYYNRCLRVLEELDDQVWVGAALNNIGGVYLDTKDYQKAIDYNQRALAINLEVKSKKGEANDLNDMGVAYGHLGRYAEAFACLNRAISLYDTIGSKNNSSATLGHLSDLYLAAPGDVLRTQGIDPAKRLDKALAVQLKAVSLALEVRDLNTQSDQWKKLSHIYEQQKNYSAALNSYRNYAKLTDSIRNDKKREEITRLNIQYDYDKKAAVLESENQKKQAELSRQKVIKNASIIVGIVLLFSATLSFVFYSRRKDAREKQKEAELKAQVSETEMKVLRAQLNPHFIFNSLNSIGDYIARHDKETADLYLVRFAKLMRLILENSEHETISLADDLKALELYIQLEALRLGNKFLYYIEVDEDIDPEQTLVPPMLLQPFVENSIWHGISPKNGDGIIHIKVQKNGGMIEYTVQDNGVGRVRSAELKKNKVKQGRRSFGIKVIQSRINIINAAKQTDAKVELTDLDEGTKVSIKLPHDLKF